MRIPDSPPKLEELLRNEATLVRVISGSVGPTPDGRYLHWDDLRHRPIPDGWTVSDYWAAIRAARSSAAKTTPFQDKAGRPMRWMLTDRLAYLLHRIDQRASGRIELPEPVTDADTRDRYVVSSLIEEAITSSQLEGAATQTPVARQMLREGRKPKDRSEQMIVNNFQAMQFIRDEAGPELTPDLVIRLQAILTRDTLDEPDQVGRLRRPDEPIHVVSQDDQTLLHVPPPAEQLPQRLACLCNFANADPDDAAQPFIHPVLRGAMLHFALAYDHPFCDGNGRTARALFYWYMVNNGYWLAEFLSISSILKDAPAQYARAYLLTETDGNDLTYFLLHHLEVVSKAIDALEAYLRRKVRQQRKAERLLGAAHRARELNHRQKALISHALRHANAQYTITSHQRSHAVTYQTARADLLALADLGLLKQEKIGRKFVYFVPEGLGTLIENLDE